ncbi:MAG: hypothetical protein APR62_12285 [Smithella sp. SDB]|nr:MAG: hypothetical protein APR62_12285 [Smithella sp. SDB]
MQELIKNKIGLRKIILNRRQAIRERCLNCSGWIPKDVAGCEMNLCPLYPFRMKKGKQDAATRQKSIRTYCINCMNGQIGVVSKCKSSDCPLFIYRKGCVVRASYIEKGVME